MTLPVYFSPNTNPHPPLSPNPPHHHQLTEGVKLSFAECFVMEYHMSQAAMVKTSLILHACGCMCAYACAQLPGSAFPVLVSSHQMEKT